MAASDRRKAEHTEEFKFRCTPEHKDFLVGLPWGQASEQLREAVDGMMAKEAKRRKDRQYRKRKKEATA